jgi:uncharacterized membrane protein
MEFMRKLSESEQLAKSFSILLSKEYSRYLDLGSHECAATDPRRDRASDAGSADTRKACFH